MGPCPHDERKCDDRGQSSRPARRRAGWQRMRDGVEMMGRAEGAQSSHDGHHCAHLKSILARAVVPSQVPAQPPRQGRQAGWLAGWTGARGTGELIRMAAISSVLLGEDWFGEGSEQPGLPPEHLRHGQSGRSGWCSLIGCCGGVKPGWDVSDNCGLGARQRLCTGWFRPKTTDDGAGWGGVHGELPSTLMRLKLSEVINWAPG